MSMTVWCCTCSRCGREVASSDKLDFDFRRGGWRYNRDTHEWMCADCVEATEGDEE